MPNNGCEKGNKKTPSQDECLIFLKNTRISFSLAKKVGKS